MALRFALDEHLRGGALWQAIQQHNGLGAYLLDVVRVGDPPDLPLGATDPDILTWTEREDRLFLSLDKRTLPGHLAAHLASGHHSPGILVIRPSSLVREILDSLVLAAHAGDPIDYEDRIEYVPF